MNRKKIFFDVLDNFNFALHHTYAEVKYDDLALQYIYIFLILLNCHKILYLKIILV